MFRKLFLSIILIFCALEILAQPKAPDFSSDPKIFAQQIKDFFLQDNHPEIKDVMEQFQDYWVKENVFSPTEQTKIIEHAKFLQKQKTKVWPEFYSYIK